MVSQQMLISVALPVAAMAIVVGSVANVQDSTLAPGLDTLDSATQFGYPEVTIDEENELRGITVFNMLSAQNCIYTSHVYHHEDTLSEDEKEELFGDFEDNQFKPLTKVDGLTEEDGEERYITASELESSQFTYWRERDVLETAMEKEDFDGTCLGGKPISKALIEQIEYLDKALSTFEKAKAFAPWNLEFGGQDSEELNRGALQGRFGRIEFNMNDTIMIDEPRLMAMKLYGEGELKEGLNPKDTPDFIRGARASVFIPEGYLRGNAEDVWDDKNPGAIKETAVAAGTYAVAGGTGAYLGWWGGAIAGATAGAVSGSVATPVGTVIGGIAGFFGGATVGVITAQSTIAQELNIGSHPAILINIDHPEGAEEGEADEDSGWFSDRGMFRYRDPDNNQEDDNWRRDINAFRVRMVNVPIVMQSTFTPRSAKNANKVSEQFGYNYISKNSNYVLCNQTEGFIQSNAGEEVEYDGKKKYQNDDPIFRDVVYPRIELSRYDISCFEDAKLSNGIGMVKGHNEFIDEDGDFKGPISSQIDYLPRRPLEQMRSEDSFEKIQNHEEKLVLDPDTQVPLYQGFKSNNDVPLTLEWWDYQAPVWYPAYGAKDTQCEKYDGEYDVTGMFTDNRENILEDMSDRDKRVYGTERPYKMTGDDIEISSEKGNGEIMPYYSFERFSEDSSITAEFEVSIEGEGTYDQIYNGAVRFPAKFNLEKKSSGQIKEGETRLSLELGSQKIYLKREKANIETTQEDGEEKTILSWHSDSTLSEAPYPVSENKPIEREFRLTIDKMGSEIIVEESTDENGGWNDLMMASVDEIEDIDHMSPYSRTANIQTGSNEVEVPKVILTLNEVAVDGTVAGCTG